MCVFVAVDLTVGFHSTVRYSSDICEVVQDARERLVDRYNELWEDNPKYKYNAMFAQIGWDKDDIKRVVYKFVNTNLNPTPLMCEMYLKYKDKIAAFLNNKQVAPVIIPHGNTKLKKRGRPPKQQDEEEEYEESNNGTGDDEEEEEGQVRKKKHTRIGKEYTDATTEQINQRIESHICEITSAKFLLRNIKEQQIQLEQSIAKRTGAVAGLRESLVQYQKITELLETQLAE